MHRVFINPRCTVLPFELSPLTSPLLHHDHSSSHLRVLSKQLRGQALQHAHRTELFQHFPPLPDVAKVRNAISAANYYPYLLHYLVHLQRRSSESLTGDRPIIPTHNRIIRCFACRAVHSLVLAVFHLLVGATHEQLRAAARRRRADATWRATGVQIGRKLPDVGQLVGGVVLLAVLDASREDAAVFLVWVLEETVTHCADLERCRCEVSVCLTCSAYM
jgi:hypothetical protein